MKIDGTLLAKETLNTLVPRIKLLKQKSVTPHLAVVVIGKDPQTASYVKQKQKNAHALGIICTIHHFTRAPMYQKLAEFILNLDHNPAVHGIIIQRPLPPSLSAGILIKRISPTKDVDAFLPKTHFVPPLAEAVFKIFNEIYYQSLSLQQKQPNDFAPEIIKWLKSRRIVLLGRGETGGKPIAQVLSNYRINVIILNSKSTNKEEYLKQADIVISAVGKPRVITADQLKRGASLIGIGIHRSSGKLKGDYDENEMKKIAAHYTPTPGGVGPLTVACLLSNVVQAAEDLSQ